MSALSGPCFMLWHIVLYRYTWQVENAHGFNVHYVRKHYRILLTADTSKHSFVYLIKGVNLLDHNHRVKKMKKIPTALTLMTLLVAMIIKIQNILIMMCHHQVKVLVMKAMIQPLKYGTWSQK